MDVTEPVVVVTEAPDAEAVAAIAEGLRAYNLEVSGVNDRRPLAVIVKDPTTGRPVGGINGRTARGLLVIEIFYLPKALRGSGLGSQVLAMAEEEGRRRGCKQAVLDTMNFQAPEFYKRQGWRVLGQIPCEPPGTVRYIMTKAL